MMKWSDIFKREHGKDMFLLLEIKTNMEWKGNAQQNCNIFPAAI